MSKLESRIWALSTSRNHHQRAKFQICPKVTQLSQDIPSEGDNYKNCHNLSQDIPSEGKDYKNCHNLSKDIPSEGENYKNCHNLSQDIPSEGDKNCYNLSQNIPSAEGEYILDPGISTCTIWEGYLG